MSHTPGPWEIATYEFQSGTICYYLAGPVSQSESDANAHLIAAAPDLLVALKEAVRSCGCSLAQRESGHHVDCFAPDALAAIAKAEGRPE